LRIVGIVQLEASALVQEILHQRINALRIITVLVDKAQLHQESISVQQVTSAKWEHHNQSDVKMVPSKMSLAKAFVRIVLKAITAMLPMQLLLMQHYVRLVIIAPVVLEIIATSLAQNVSTLHILTRTAGLLGQGSLIL